jgi:hypothetical protein
MLSDIINIGAVKSISGADTKMKILFASVSPKKKRNWNGFH